MVRLAHSLPISSIKTGYSTLRCSYIYADETSLWPEREVGNFRPSTLLL